MFLFFCFLSFLVFLVCSTFLLYIILATFKIPQNLQLLKNAKKILLNLRANQSYSSDSSTLTSDLMSCSKVKVSGVIEKSI